MSLNRRCMWKTTAKNPLHSQLQLRTATTAIEENLTNRACHSLRQQLTSQNSIDDITILMERIDTLCGDTVYHLSVTHQSPVGFGTSTVCYQYHVAKLHIFSENNSRT